MKRDAFLFCLCVVLLVTGASARQKRWFELYDEARQHVQRQEWALAETKMNDAKKLGPGPGRTVLRYGNWRDDFFPDYYLGVIYFNTGRAELALKQFSLARTQKLNLQDREFALLTDFESKAGTALQARNSAEPAPVGGTTATPPGATPSSTPAGTTTTPPNVAPPQPVNPASNPAQQFAQLIADAQSLIKQKRYPEAENSLQRAESLNVDRVRVDSVRRSAQLASAIDQAEAALESRNVEAARSAIATAQKLGAFSVLLEDYTKRLRAIEREATAATTERAAMVAYFKGDYPNAIALLAALEKGGPLSARGHFYHACALAAVALRGEQADAKGLSAARRQFQQAGKDRQTVTAHRRFVSPKILQALGS